MSEQAADLRASILAELETNPSAVIDRYQKGQVLERIDAGKNRKTLRTLVAEEFPGTAERMPETAVAQAVAPALALLQAERAALQKERQDEQEKKNRESFRASLRAEGIPDAHLDDVEKLAIDTANLDPKALALRWQASQTPARSSAGFGRPMIPGGKGTGDYFAGLQSDPDAWLLNRSELLWDAVSKGRDPDMIDWSKEVVA